MKLLERLATTIQDELQYWSDAKSRLGKDADKQLENLDIFYKDVLFQETLEQTRTDWEAAKLKCNELGHWLQVGDKRMEASKVKEVEILLTIKKVNVLSHCAGGAAAGERTLELGQSSLCCCSHSLLMPPAARQ